MPAPEAVPTLAYRSARSSLGAALSDAFIDGRDVVESTPCVEQSLYEGGIIMGFWRRWFATAPMPTFCPVCRVERKFAGATGVLSFCTTCFVVQVNHFPDTHPVPGQRPDQ